MVGQWRGGPWTDIKLDVLERYLAAWSRVFQNQGHRYTRIYIDAFAGTGGRFFGAEDGGLNLIDAYDQELAGGSARRALAVRPPFDQLYFIEKVGARFEELTTSLTRDFPERQSCMHFLQGDANDQIAKLCGSIDWRRSRAVLFLDPFGMQVDWSTIEAIARTEAVDLWYLVPTAIGIGRTLVRQGEVPKEWAERLDRMLGTDAWRTEWYKTTRTPDLFSQTTERTVRTADLDDIEAWFLRRVNDLFAGGAATRGKRLKQNGRPMYLLIFACANRNPRARSIALRIADNVIGKRG